MHRFAMGFVFLFLGSLTSWAIPGKPALLSPAPIDYAQRRPLFQWTQAANATKYMISIKRSNGSTYLEKWTSRTYWTPAVDLPEGVYDVRVIGYDGADYGKWSPTVRFRRVFSPYLASVNGIRLDGGNIELMAGPGIAIDIDPNIPGIYISATGTSSVEIIDQAITTTKLADGSVTSDKIADGAIVDADIAANAAIADGKLATITTAGKVANSATTANSGNTGNTLVLRNGSGNFAAGAITATAFSGGGASLTGLNASQLTSGTVPVERLPAALTSNQVWLLGGNAGTAAGVQFLGTTDNQPLEIKVNGVRAVRLQDNGDGLDSGTVRDGAPNIILGSPANGISAGIVGSAIGGGGTTNLTGFAIGNYISAEYSVIGGGLGNNILVGSERGVIGGGYVNIIYSNAYASTIGGGQGNAIQPLAYNSSIAGGVNNTIFLNAYNSSIGGGNYNRIDTNSNASTIGGGYQNRIGTNAMSSTISGGNENKVEPTAFRATIGGGFRNTIQWYAYESVIGGGSENAIQTNSVDSTIGGGFHNIIQPYAYDATIAGGFRNTICTSATYSAIGGGEQNSVASTHSAIAGGYQNTIHPNASLSAIGGGSYNTIQFNAPNSTIAGGQQNTIQTDASESTISGGLGNTIQTNAIGSVIAGGTGNTILGSFGTIPGGSLNSATNHAFAAGRLARAIHTGSFVWGDSTYQYVFSATNDSVTMRAAGGYRLYSNGGMSAGVTLAAGGTSWSALSDRNQKKDFEPVDSREVLEALAALPITRWHYLWEADGETLHMGPMAQDFIPAFYPGRDDTRITTQEADGVALAAIQGLNQKVDDEVAQLRAENEALKARLDRLEKLLVP